MALNVLVCVKRVPDTGGGFRIASDGLHLETTGLEFTVSPHEECAVEEAIRLVEQHGGEATVLTLGPPEAQEQLREALAKGAHRAIFIEAPDYEAWDPRATAQAIAGAVRDRGFDVLLFGNESADASQYQVGPWVAKLLGLPCVTGVKALQIQDGKAVAKREVRGGFQVYEVPLPAVFTVKEGINQPRHPSLRGIMQAKKVPIERQTPSRPEPQLVRQALKAPPERGGQVEILGQGAEAVPKLVAKLREMGVL